MAFCGATSNDYPQCESNDCYDIVRSTKTVTLPCTRNVVEQVTVNVPQQKEYTVNRNVPYTDYEERVRKVPYSYTENETVTRNVPVCQKVPIKKTFNYNERVVVKVPKVVWVNTVKCIPKKTVRTCYVNKRSYVPKQVTQPVTKTGWKDVKERVPVTRYRTVTEKKSKTELVPEKRYRCKTQTKMVTKSIPTYQIVPRRPNPCTLPAENLQTAHSGEMYYAGPVPASPTQGLYSRKWQNNGAQVIEPPLQVNTSRIMYPPVHKASSVPNAKLTALAYDKHGYPTQREKSGLRAKVNAANASAKSPSSFV